MVIIWNLCVLYRSQEQTVTFVLCIRLVFISEVESVYCAVRTESLYNTHTFRFQQFNPVDTCVLTVVFS
jgi:hypothetical protein